MPHCPTFTSHTNTHRHTAPGTWLISGPACLACSASACRVPCRSSRLWRWRGGHRWGHPPRRAPLLWAARSRRAPVVGPSLEGRRRRRWRFVTASLQTRTARQVHTPVSLCVCVVCVYKLLFCMCVLSLEMIQTLYADTHTHTFQFTCTRSIS